MFTINQDIVDVINNDILFNINDKESTSTHEHALSIFKLFEDVNNE